MMLSKFVKKITSIGLAAAMVVSGFTYQPAKAEAAELPVVTVLGATLSLDAEAGKQSMRVAIKVENADNASACGMKITYNGVEKTFATNDGVNNKLYDADMETNTIVYTVKIANIPSDNFKDNFSIEGFATPITGAEAGEKVTTGAPVEKSVNSVVAAISAQDSSVDMKNSKLVKKLTSLDITNVASLSSSGDDRFILSSETVGSSVAEYDSENDCAIIKTYDTEGNEAAFTANNSNGTNQLVGLVYRFVAGRDIDYVIETVVDNTDNVQFIGSWGGAIAPSSTVQEDGWVKLSYEIKAGGWWNYGYRTTSPKSVKLKEYSIYKVLKDGEIADTKLFLKSQLLDLSTLTATDGSVVENNNDGTLTITTKGQYTGGIKIPVPKLKVANPKKLEIAIEAVNGGGGQFKVKFADGTQSADFYNWDGENVSNYGDSTLSFDGKIPVEIILNSQGDGTVWLLKYIKIEE